MKFWNSIYDYLFGYSLERSTWNYF